MAILFGLLSMAVKAIRNNADPQDQHHNGQSYNNNNTAYNPSTHYPSEPYYGSKQCCGRRGVRRMERKTRKAERMARRADRMACHAERIAERRGLAFANPPPANVAPYSKDGDERRVHPLAAQGAAHQYYYPQSGEDHRDVYNAAGPGEVRGTVSQVSLPLDEPPAYEQVVGTSSRTTVNDKVR